LCSLENFKVVFSLEFCQGSVGVLSGFGRSFVKVLVPFGGFLSEEFRVLFSLEDFRVAFSLEFC